MCLVAAILMSLLLIILFNNIVADKNTTFSILLDDVLETRYAYHGNGMQSKVQAKHSNSRALWLSADL